jgi:hypothetical protein
MLNQVPNALAQMARQVVLNHPNRWDVSVFRKRVNRHDEPEDDSMGHLPTLGGLGVLDSEDEEDVTWDFVGHGVMLRTEAYQASKMTDRRDATNSEGAEITVMIEPEDDPGEPGWFKPKNHDIVDVWLGDNVKIAYEIIAVESVVDIPPYVPRYVMNRRDDLLYVDFSESGGGGNGPGSDPLNGGDLNT